MVSGDLKIHSIAACCNNWGIGYRGVLPWQLRKEYKHFANLTIGNPPKGKQNAIVMGRKTWDSLSPSCHPLKNRYNFILSSTSDRKCDGADAVVSSLTEFVNLLQSSEWKDKVHDVFNVGGSSIYKLIQDSPYCGNVFLTRIFADFECDTFFPALGEEFSCIPIEKFPDVPQGVQEENGIEWKVEVYTKQR